ncbi:hypothetical protein SCA6_017742 [Theobroma cacao]
MALPKAKEVVSANPVVVFSKSYCPYCVNAVKTASKSDGSEIQAALAEWTGLRTVPNVFIGGKHIGGCDVTTTLHEEGKLIPLLTEAGAVAKPSDSL